jgi:hypothetical protein
MTPGDICSVFGVGFYFVFFIVFEVAHRHDKAEMDNILMTISSFSVPSLQTRILTGPSGGGVRARPRRGWRAMTTARRLGRLMVVKNQRWMRTILGSAMQAQRLSIIFLVIL